MWSLYYFKKRQFKYIISNVKDKEEICWRYLCIDQDPDDEEQEQEDNHEF